MGAAAVVELLAPIESRLQGSGVGEESPAELDPPELAQDRALQALDEAIGPVMARLGAGMADVALGAGLVEGSPVFVALIGQDALQRPAGCLESRQHTPGDTVPVSFREEAGRRCGRELQADLGHRKRAGGIAGGVLPDLPHPLELADVERVQADQLPGLACLNVRPLAPLSRGQLAPGALGQEPHRLGAVRFEHCEAFPAGLKPYPPQQAVDRAGCHCQATVLRPAQLVGQLGRPPGRPRQGQGENRPFCLEAEHRWPPSARALPTRVQPVPTVHHVPLPPSVEQSAGDAELPAGLADVAELPCPEHDLKAKSVYALVEGHGRSSPSPREGTLSNGKDTAHDPRSLCTPLRNSTHRPHGVPLAGPRERPGPGRAVARGGLSRCGPRA